MWCEHSHGLYASQVVADIVRHHAASQLDTQHTNAPTHALTHVGTSHTIGCLHGLILLSQCGG